MNVWRIKLEKAAWIPFGYISVLVGLDFVVLDGIGNGPLLAFAFLPLCFFFVCANQYGLVKKIRALESQLDQNQSSKEGY